MILKNTQIVISNDKIINVQYSKQENAQKYNEKKHSNILEYSTTKNVQFQKLRQKSVQICVLI